MMTTAIYIRLTLRLKSISSINSIKIVAGIIELRIEIGHQTSLGSNGHRYWPGSLKTLNKKINTPAKTVVISKLETQIAIGFLVLNQSDKPKAARTAPEKAGKNRIRWAIPVDKTGICQS